MSGIRLEPVDRVQITILMDNVTDPLLADQDAVVRMNWPKALLGGLPTAQARVSPATGVPDALIAEPGFSALVRIEQDGRERTLLFDTGVSANEMVEDMRRLGIDPADVEVIVLSGLARKFFDDGNSRIVPHRDAKTTRANVAYLRKRPLSHGHWEHVTGMEGLARVLGRTRLPVMIHPEFWSRRRISFPGLEAEFPAPVAPRCRRWNLRSSRSASRRSCSTAVLITGEVDRTTAFETGFQGHQALREWELAGGPADPR